MNNNYLIYKYLKKNSEVADLASGIGWTSALISKNPNVDYLLVIEGNTQRSNNNWVTIPNAGYKLSYDRALSLFNYWKNRGLNFRDIGNNCEHELEKDSHVVLAVAFHIMDSLDQSSRMQLVRLASPATYTPVTRLE